MRHAKPKRPLFLYFEMVVIGLVVFCSIAVMRGVIHEQELARHQYRPGITAIGLSAVDPFSRESIPLDKHLIGTVEDRDAVITEYLSSDEGRSSHLGVSPAYLELFQPALRTGRYFTQNDGHACLISEDLAKSMYQTIEESLGKEYRSAYIPFPLTIVGVLIQGEEVPVRTLEFLSGRPVESLNAITENMLVYPISKHQFDSSMPVSRTIWLKGNERDARKIVDALSVYDDEIAFSINPLPRLAFPDSKSKMLLLGLLTGFTFLLLLVSGLGMSGIQLIQVLRKQPEIGIRIAVGARRFHIVLLVLRQAFIHLTIPTIAGLILGYIILPAISDLTGLPILIDTLLPVYTSFILLVFGATVSFYPALKAACLDPIQAIGQSPR